MSFFKSLFSLFCCCLFCPFSAFFSFSPHCSYFLLCHSLLLFLPFLFFKSFFVLFLLIFFYPFPRFFSAFVSCFFPFSHLFLFPPFSPLSAFSAFSIFLNPFFSFLSYFFFSPYSLSPPPFPPFSPFFSPKNRSVNISVNRPTFGRLPITF